MEEEIDSNNESNSVNDSVALSNAKTKKKKAGIIYLSTIPPKMTVMQLREILGEYGEIGRMFLQEDVTKSKAKKRRRKRAKDFVEGWVEFKSKRIAKEVASVLNNTQIGGRKRSRFYDHIWSIKYLPRFKWIHLNERLAYERAVHKQRLRAEIAQAKREANFFSHNIEISEKLKKRKGKGAQKEENQEVSNTFQISQRRTEDEIIKKKTLSKTHEDKDERDDFLKSLFAQ